ncbi:DUF4367 domain-containing protein [Vagococcus hydrophili]|uniref:DUF4367 domain-containing protein n=1 Tax=Vagococcus hydrophili TaxID=2714947 RepID=A0A6G8AWW1_9ENTE|nr:DUF4367 domain-containing protein [Vagococcus hydrophili]QIL49449.1 DUF4367 domain-containing protein [Vagococcus hydrophili]
MTNDYKKQVSKIKTPESLKMRTKELMEQELNQTEKEVTKEIKQEKAKIIKIKPQYKHLLQVAVIIGIIVIPSIYFSQNHYKVVSVEPNQFNFSPNLGKLGDVSSKDQYTIQKSDSADVIPEFLKEVKEGKIKGVNVRVAKDKKGKFYASFEKDKTFYYIEGKDITEKEFIDYLKKLF